MDLLTVGIPVFIAAFSSLFTIVNPFSTAFVFLTITRGNSKAQKKKIARKACITAAVILIIFSIAGSYILSFFSITLEAFRIAGGIIIASMGFQMLHAGKTHFHTQKEKTEAIAKDDVSIIPLAIPMMSGPGAMTTSIVLMGNTDSVFDKTFIVAAIIFVAISAYFILKHASTIQKILGQTGLKVVDKVMGLIVLVVGVQFIINGLHTLLDSWI